MPRPTDFLSAVQKLVRDQVQQAVRGLFGSTRPRKKKAKNGRRRRRRRRGRGSGRSKTK